MSSIQSIQSCNDFVIKFANINGSGSASANELFARAIMGMGVPVAPRNIFPSNIQGMPTWYEMRVSAEGWLGRRGGSSAPGAAGRFHTPVRAIPARPRSRKFPLPEVSAHR